jgi:hypothetical protein
MKKETIQTLDTLFNESEEKYKKDKFYKHIKYILRKTKKTEVEELMLRCIEKYNDALNQDDLSHRFMCFWRLCEYALQPCDVGSQKVVKLQNRS